MYCYMILIVLIYRLHTVILKEMDATNIYMYTDSAQYMYIYNTRDSSREYL